MEFVLHLVPELFASLVFGALIGLEREFKHKAAGLRTLILISLGSTLIMVLSVRIQELVETASLENVSITVDVSRIAAGIVTGIGFLGAGTIIQARGGIQGLTTAATIWVTAGIGMAVGLGHFLLAAFATLLVLCILRGMGYLEGIMKTKCRVAYFYVEGKDSEILMEKTRSAMLSSHIEPKGLKIERSDDQIAIRFAICQTSTTHEKILEELRSLPEVTSVRYL